MFYKLDFLKENPFDLAIILDDPVYYPGPGTLLFLGIGSALFNANLGFGSKE